MAARKLILIHISNFLRVMKDVGTLQPSCCRGNTFRNADGCRLGI